MRTHSRGARLVALLALAVAMVLAVTVSASSLVVEAQATSTVKVTLGTSAKPFALIPSPRSAKAGRVTFVVTNKGKMTHEFVVLKTKTAAAKLPVKEGEASEAGLVGEISSVKPGQTKKLTLRLKAGHHVLLCNLAGHYQSGQRSDFNVK